MDSGVVRPVQIVILFLLIGLLLWGCGGKEEAQRSKGYDFTLYDLQGQQVSFSDFQGQVIMVNFWAPWCGPCRMETPDLIDLHEQYKQDGLRILGVAVAFRGEESVRDFAENAGVSYPILLGNNDLVKNYGGFRGIPATFLFARDGKLYRKYIGARPRDIFEKDILELL
jgi:thiol-disulfide isomerase/thioredoxin